MPIAISDDHLELSSVATDFLSRAGALAEARALLDAPEEALPAAWKEMADLGWLGLHVPEAHVQLPDVQRKDVQKLDDPPDVVLTYSDAPPAPRQVTAGSRRCLVLAWSTAPAGHRGWRAS